MSNQRTILLLFIVVGVIALYCQLDLGNGSDFHDKSAYELPKVSSHPSWHLIENETSEDRWSFENAFFLDVSERTPLSDREFMLTKFSHRADYNWVVVGSGKAMAYSLKGSDSGSFDKNAIPSHRAIKGIEGLEERLEQVRGWTKGAPCPSWLTISQSRAGSEESPTACVYLKADGKRPRIFSLFTEDAQVNAIVFPGIPFLEP